MSHAEHQGRTVLRRNSNILKDNGESKQRDTKELTQIWARLDQSDGETDISRTYTSPENMISAEEKGRATAAISEPTFELIRLYHDREWLMISTDMIISSDKAKVSGSIVRVGRRYASNRMDSTTPSHP